MNLGLFFLYFPFAVALFAFAVFVRPLRLSRRAQLLALAGLLLASAKFCVYRRFGGDMFVPELPFALIWGLDLCYSTVLLLAPLSVPGLLLPRRLRAAVVPVLALALAAYGISWVVRAPQVRELELFFPALPAALDGYRIAHLSDLHISSAARAEHTEKVVQAVNALTPDLICITGDIVDGMPQRRLDDVLPLKGLCARDGVFACTGNHEYFGPWLEWRGIFARAGIWTLENECVFPHEGLALGGVNDRTVRWGVAGFGRLPDVRDTFAAATNGEFRLLLEHRPVRAPENLREVGVDLQLSGHTHGGVMPGMAYLVARHNGGFVRGLYPLEGGYLHVSPGTGQWAGFPIRFFNDAEITLITLRKDW